MHWIALQPWPEPGVDPGAGMTALAWAALGFTPRVARVADLAGDLLVLEVAASERLFGGRRALLARFLARLPPDVPLRWAHAATSLIAIGRLLAAAPVPSGGAAVAAAASAGVAPALKVRQRPASQLPLPALAAARPHLATLAGLVQ